MKLSDKGRDLVIAAYEHVLQSRPEIEIFYALRRPIGADIAALHAPHFLGVGLEENLEQPAAKPVADPFLEAFVFGGREKSGPDVACHDAAALRSAQDREAH